MRVHDVERLRGLFVAAVLLTAGCSRPEAHADARDPVAVRLVAVESARDAESTSYSAVIAPNVQVDLAFRVSGYVVDIHRARGADGRTRAVEPGATVATGMVLARVRTTEYQA